MVIGFAAETENILINAKSKLKKKAVILLLLMMFP